MTPTMDSRQVGVGSNPCAHDTHTAGSRCKLENVCLTLLTCASSLKLTRSKEPQGCRLVDSFCVKQEWEEARFGIQKASVKLRSSQEPHRGSIRTADPKMGRGLVITEMAKSYECATSIRYAE